VVLVGGTSLAARWMSRANDHIDKRHGSVREKDIGEEYGADKWDPRPHPQIPHVMPSCR
jgi:hypothetical protein